MGTDELPSFGERFQAQELLGSGGMACVYRVRDSVQQKDLAVKLLHPEQANTLAKKERFQREFSLLQRLKHPGVLRVYELFEQEGSIFFTMELVQGEPLETFFQTHQQKDENGSLHTPAEVVIPLLLQISEVLAYVHSQKLVYCDLKPDNLLLCDKDSEKQVKLFDFGIAYDMQSDAQEDRKMLGTSAYMSPEQIRSEALDGRSDIYSFGILAFHLLTGRLPFGDESLFAVSAAHLIGKAPSAKRFNPSVSASLERMIQVCMEKDRNDRYGSMDELTSRLKSLHRKSGEGSLLSNLFGKLFSK